MHFCDIHAFWKKYTYRSGENVAKEMINEVPMKRYGTIDEVIDPVLFLLSDESSYITGTDIKITGGI